MILQADVSGDEHEHEHQSISWSESLQSAGYLELPEMIVSAVKVANMAAGCNDHDTSSGLGPKNSGLMLAGFVLQDGRLPIDMFGLKASAILSRLNAAHVVLRLTPHLQLLEACRKPGAEACTALSHILKGPSYHDARAKLQSARLPISSCWILFLVGNQALTAEAGPSDRPDSTT